MARKEFQQFAEVDPEKWRLSQKGVRTRAAGLLTIDSVFLSVPFGAGRLRCLLIGPPPLPGQGKVQGGGPKRRSLDAPPPPDRATCAHFWGLRGCYRVASQPARGRSDPLSQCDLCDSHAYTPLDELVPVVGSDTEWIDRAFALGKLAGQVIQ